MDEREVGMRVLAIRKQLGIRQIDLAEKAGISRQLLYRYETGKLKHIPKDTIEKLAKALNVLPSELYGWENAVRNAFINTYDALDDDDQALAFKFLLTLAANKKYDGIINTDGIGERNES